MLIYNHVSQTTSCDGKHVEEFSVADAYVAFQRNHSAFNSASYIYSKIGGESSESAKYLQIFYAVIQAEWRSLE